MSSAITLLATGDVAPRRADPASMFARVRKTLNSGDVVFGQLETTISDRGAALPQAKLAMRTDPAVAMAIRDAGYNVVSFAGNHCMDWGQSAFFDTLDHIASAGLHLCGAGADIEAARRPVTIDSHGTKIAFLAYSSILPMGYWAESRRPGCAPMRALTTYTQIETDQPGTPAHIDTWAHREDLEALRADIRIAKSKADIVAVSMHWGIHFVPSEIATYQREVAHAAIDAGADVILGHHPHILKGIEFYKERPIFYSLANFAIEQPQAFDPTILQTASFKHLMSLNPGMDPTQMFVCPPDSRKSIIAKLTIDDKRLTRVAFLPVDINDASEPETLAPTDPRFAAVLEYIQRVTVEQGLHAAFHVEDGEVVVGC
jgi:poly-gamma-glutamate synthesis protein (capsule biosynthesis protein)